MHFQVDMITRGTAFGKAATSAGQINWKYIGKSQYPPYRVPNPLFEAPFLLICTPRIVIVSEYIYSKWMQNWLS